MLSLLMKLHLSLLHSSREWSLTCLMILVSLNWLLINIEEIITSFTPYSKYFFVMFTIRFEMRFASVLLIELCVISFEPTRIIIMSNRSSSKTGVMKWSNLLIVAPRKLFKCSLPSVIELLNYWIIKYIYIFNSAHMIIAHDKCFFKNSFFKKCFFQLPRTVLIEFLRCVVFICCYCIRWTNTLWTIFFGS